jgi:hypothetical protein
MGRLSRIPTSYAVFLLLVASSILFTFHAVSLTRSFASFIPPGKSPPRDDTSIAGSSDATSIAGSSAAAPSSAAAAASNDGSRRRSASAERSSHLPSSNRISGIVSGAQPVVVDLQSKPSVSQRSPAFEASSNGMQHHLDDHLCSELSSSSLRPLAPSSPESPPLLPWPLHVMAGSQGEGRACDSGGTCCGPFTVAETTPVLVISPQSKDTAGIKAIVKRAAVAISALAHRDAVLLPRIKVCILRPEENPNAGVSEEYSLRVSGNGIVIKCDNKAGLAWALSTLQQLLQDYSKMCVLFINDIPRLSHRGVLLDVARNYVPLADLNLLLKTMSAVKLNVLHLHLTDDQVLTSCQTHFQNFSLLILLLLLLLLTTPPSNPGICVRQQFLPRVHVIRSCAPLEPVFSRGSAFHSQRSCGLGYKGYP